MNSMSEQSHNPSVEALLRDFLLWVEREPRTYQDVMDAWRSTCPRLTVWEDALIAGYVELEQGSAPQRVMLTPRGLDRLTS
jgi:hypothetical protein